METRNQYLSNAEYAIAAGENRKASELLWGAIRQQLRRLTLTTFYLPVIVSSLIFFASMPQNLANESSMRILYFKRVACQLLRLNHSSGRVSNVLSKGHRLHHTPRKSRGNTQDKS